MSSVGARLMAATVLMLTCATGCAVEPSASSAASSSVAASSAASSSAAVPATRQSPAGTHGTPAPTACSLPAVRSSPNLFPQKDGVLGPKPSPPGQLTLASSGGRTRDGKPYEPVVFSTQDLWLAPTGAATDFVLEIDAGSTVGAATQARVSYDLTGDGSWDRIETYRYFATDPKAGPERYTQDAGLRSSEGKLGELCGGVVRLEVWSTLGAGGTVVDLPASSLTLPYR